MYQKHSPSGGVFCSGCAVLQSAWLAYIQADVHCEVNETCKDSGLDCLVSIAATFREMFASIQYGDCP